MRAPLTLAALAALVAAACAPTLAAPGEDTRFLADFPECPYEWLVMVRGSSRASLYMAAVREGGDAVVNAHEIPAGQRAGRTRATQQPRWQGSAIKLLDPACQLDGASVTQSPSTTEREILTAAIGYYQGHIASTRNLADSVIAIDVRPARVSTPSGPPLDPNRAAHAEPHVLREVAADLRSPVGDPEAVECRPVEDPRGAYCSPIGAAAVVSVGRILVEDGRAQVELRAWLPSELPRVRAARPEGRLGERGDLVALEKVDGEWTVTSHRGLFVS